MAKGIINSNKLTINTNYFTSGVGVDLKLAPPNSFYKSSAFDFRTIPSQMSVLPAPRALSTTLPDLITAMEQDLNGIRWGIGDKGNFYRIDATDTISVEGKLTENGTAGLLYNQVTDQLYIPGQTKVSMYGQVTTGNPGQPRFQQDIFAQSESINSGCTQLFDPDTGLFDGALRSSASAAYGVPTTLTEDEATRCPFSPDIEPGYSHKVFILTKGTGNYTLTLHDSQNNSLAAVTIANASITANAFNEFVFGKQVRALVGGGIASGAATYHFHLTSTVGDGTVQVVPVSDGNNATGDMRSVNMTWSAYRLVDTVNGWHPTALFSVQTGTGNGQALCIGNGQYLSTYNFGNDSNPSNLDWIRHQLVFKTGFEVCGLSTNNQYLVIAVERRSKNSSRNFQDGALYFWDGTTPQPSFVIDIPMGAPYGLSTTNNITYFTAAGSLFAWSGGQTVIKVRKLAYQNTDYLNAVDTTIINPNMMTNRYNILMMAYPSKTTNPNITYGTWSWGTSELTFPNSYGLSYLLSNGYQNNASPISNLQMGCNVNFVDSMYTSWAYTLSGTTHYGLDLLDNFSTAATTASWQSLIYDGGARYKEKVANRLKISFEPLATGCTVTPYYILDRGTTVTSTAPAGTGNTDALIEINTRFHEIQYGFTVTCPSGTTVPPTITGVTLEADPTQEEVEVTADN